MTAQELDTGASSTAIPWQGAVKIVLIGAAAVAVQTAAAGYQLSTMNTAMIMAIGAMALTLVMGLAGLVTVGNAALLGIGAFGTAFLVGSFELPFVAVLLIAATFGSLIGIIIGLPALRMGGIYLAIATLALHYVAIYFLTDYQTREVGSSGFLVPEADLFGWSVTSNGEWFYFLLVLTVATYVVLQNLKQSKYGLAWRFLRDQPLAAETMGVGPAYFKLLAFVISSAIVAVSGALLAYYNQFVYVETFTLHLAIEYIAMVVIGGFGSVGGAVAGAGLVILMPTAINTVLDVLPEGAALTDLLRQNIGEVQLITYGVIVLVFLMYQPDGLAGLYARVKSAVRSMSTASRSVR